MQGTRLGPQHLAVQGLFPTVLRLHRRSLAIPRCMLLWLHLLLAMVD